MDNDDFTVQDIERFRNAMKGIQAQPPLFDDPPVDLWAAIEREALGSPELAASPAPIEPEPTVVTPFERPSPPTPIQRAGTHELARDRNRFMAVAAAVVVAILGAGLFAALTANSGAVVAEAAIVADELPVQGADPGVARIVERDGEFRLELDLDPEQLETLGDGFVEVWLIDTDVVGMHSLGIVEGQTSFPLPDGLDPEDFPVVDLSIEPIDGDPTHSGASILRGVLDFTT